MSSTTTLRQLSRAEWEAAMRAHEQRARTWIDPHLDRRARGQKHPVWDFLFDYYPVRPTHLLRWHPGAGTSLIDATSTPPAPHLLWRDYAAVPDDSVTVDIDAFLEHRRDDMAAILAMLEAMEANRPQFDCFGLHEWAMVYKTQNPRHDLPLRLGEAGTNAVVDRHTLKCTHFDAFRFFTQPARPLNLTVLGSADRGYSDQCGCLHVGMDLYRWAAKMGPLTPGPLLLDCFELARDIRRTDMEASPYDCRGLGFGVVPIETPEGKAEYVARQRDFTRRGEPLRHQLMAILREVLNR